MYYIAVFVIGRMLECGHGTLHIFVPYEHVNTVVALIKIGHRLSGEICLGIDFRGLICHCVDNSELIGKLKNGDFRESRA